MSEIKLVINGAGASANSCAKMYIAVGVKKENILYKCGWSPFEGYNFKSRVTHTFVNGKLVYANGKVKETKVGQRLLFDRNI